MEKLLRVKDLLTMMEIGYQEPIETTLLTGEQLELLRNSKTNYHKVKRYIFRVINR